MKTLRLALAALLLGLGSAHAASVSYLLDLTNGDTYQDGSPCGACLLQDGTNYAQVTISDVGVDSINFTVTLLAPLTSIADSNFGIMGFGFNVNPDGASPLLASEITLANPANWTTNVGFKPANNEYPLDGFGRFEVALETNTAASRQNPVLSFNITRAGDSIGTYVDYSARSNGDPATGAFTPTQGLTYFALHVGGYTDQNPLAPLDPIDGEGLCIDDGQGNYTDGCNINTSAWFGGTAIDDQTVVPVPAAAWLFGSAFGLLGFVRRRIGQ